MRTTFCRWRVIVCIPKGEVRCMPCIARDTGILVNNASILLSRMVAAGLIVRAKSSETNQCKHPNCRTRLGSLVFRVTDLGESYRNDESMINAPRGSYVRSIAT